MASWVFSCWSRLLRWRQALIDWGQSIYHAAQAVASWVFLLLVSLVAVASGADRLGTIDLPRANWLNKEQTAFGPVWVQSHAIERRVSVVKSDGAVVLQKLLASFGFLSGTLNSILLGRRGFETVLSRKGFFGIRRSVACRWEGAKFAWARCIRIGIALGLLTKACCGQAEPQCVGKKSRSQGPSIHGPSPKGRGGGISVAIRWAKHRQSSQLRGSTFEPPWILLIQAGGQARISSYPQNLEMR